MRLPTSAKGSVGRPRLGPRQRGGDNAREEILDAAAQLFTEQGYAATSTRAIAFAVGIKQASLYYHFPSKEQMLFDLLVGTVQPSLDVAEQLRTCGEAAEVQLWALAASDVRLLCAGPWNLGALYLLPELRAERFAPFHVERNRLRCAYGNLVRAGMSSGVFTLDEPGLLTDLVFALVESVIPLRQERGTLDADTLAATLADACLRLLSCSGGELIAIRRRAEAVHLLG